MPRVLVTGGAGFIGSHVVDRFAAHGYDVEVLDNLSTGRRENLHPKARLHELDIRAAEAARLVREGQFDVIAHLAAQIDVRRSVADPVNDAGINVLGTINLAEAVRQSATPARTRFVFSSTGGALYGDFVEPPNVETYPKDPESPYGIAKLSAEYYLAYYARVHGVETAAVRFANVYGPRQDPHGEAGVVAIFCGRLLDGRPLTVFGDGSQTRDYVYVGDVAEATFLAATHALPEPGRLDARGFNVGTGEETSVVALAEALGRVAGTPPRIEYAPSRPGEQQRSVVNNAKARSVLGWQPQHRLEDGLGETYRFFAARRAAAEARPTAASPAPSGAAR
ncbi:MAG TPA: NAD-dependent epimerase/dehydratase family protein [Gemmatimonadaceae bacterium]|nr:NAD-dependent epimerase/dehydratase family protein [Gemmatimonadaceae bacterium]